MSAQWPQSEIEQKFNWGTHKKSNQPTKEAMNPDEPHHKVES